MKKGEWRELVHAQLNLRDTMLKTGLPRSDADNMLVRNLQEFVRLSNLRNTYKLQKEILKGKEKL